MFHKAITFEGQEDSAEWQQDAEHYVMFLTRLNEPRLKKKTVIQVGYYALLFQEGCVKRK